MKQPKTLQQNLMGLAKIFDPTDLPLLVSNHPEILVYNPKALGEKLTAFASYAGLEHDFVLAIVLKHPKCMVM